MHVYLLAASLSLGLITLSGCVTPRPEHETSLSGTVVVVGNEPFTRLAVQGEAGKTLILRCAPEIQKKLVQLQGRRVTLRVLPAGRAPEGEQVEVVRVEETLP